MASRMTDRYRDREGVDESGCAGAGQDEEDFLRGVGGQRKRIRREDGQSDELADRLVFHVGGLQRSPDQPRAP